MMPDAKPAEYLRTSQGRYHLGICLLTFAAAIFTALSAARVFFTYERAEGTVIERTSDDYEKHRMDPSAILAGAAKIRYEVPGSGAKEFFSTYTTDGPGIPAGTKVQVLYDTNSGKQVVDSFWSLWPIPLILGLLTLFFAAPLMLALRAPSDTHQSIGK